MAQVIRSTVDLPWGSVSYLEWSSVTTVSEFPVLLLHGGGVDSAALSWGDLGPRLAAGGYRVVAPDHPGFGASPPAPWPAIQDRFVTYVGEFIDALGLDGAVLGGLSLGGGLTIGHVLARPESVRGAILLGSYGLMPRLSDGPLSLPRQILTFGLLRTGMLGAMTLGLARSDAGMKWSMASLVRDPARRTPELLAEVRAAARVGSGFAPFEQWQRDQIRWNRLATDYRNRLPEISAPTLVVHGDRDSGVPVARAREAAALIPQARLEVLGGGHWVQRDQPEAVSAALLRFLDDL